MAVRVLHRHLYGHRARPPAAGEARLRPLDRDGVGRRLPLRAMIFALLVALATAAVAALAYGAHAGGGPLAIAPPPGAVPPPLGDGIRGRAPAPPGGFGGAGGPA